MRKFIETMLCGRDLIKGINTEAVPSLVRFSETFKMDKGATRKMNQKTTKLMTLYKAL